MDEFDAIAIGGGLAGAAFAIELARNGRRVAIVERTAAPTLKVCGDFLSREAQELLSHLGVDVFALGATHIRTLRLRSGRQVASAELPFRAAGISRLLLDEAMLSHAEAERVTVVRGARVTALVPDGHWVSIGVGDEVLRTKSAALASGKHNVRGWPRPSDAAMAYKIQLQLSPQATRDLDGVVQLAGYEGGYIGACNVEEGRATICWLLDAGAVQQIGAGWKAQLAWIKKQSQSVGDLLQGARFLSDRPAAITGIPYGYMRRAAIAPNVFALGDQLCVIPSFTGDGTSLALSSGVAAAQAVLAGRTAEAFQRSFLRGVRGQFFWAKAVEATFRSAPLRALSIGAVSAMPKLVGLAVSLTRVKDVARISCPPSVGVTAPAR
jgi:menaquinone-9 beta-reductase